MNLDGFHDGLPGVRYTAAKECHMQGAETKVFFSGESTAQADYKAPPPDVVKLAMQGGQPPPRLPTGDPSARFEGQSRTHCDYQPPPLEAFRVTSALPTLLCPDMQPSIPFVGQSSMHADYAAPPVATAFSAPVACRQSAAQDIIHPHPSQKSVSTAHHDYKAPGLEQLRQALVQSGIEAPQIPLPRTKFEGESCTHRDFQAPPSVIPEFRAPLGDAMPAVRELLQPTAGMLNESTTQHDYRAPPLGSWYPDLSSTREETIPLPRTRFQGESTAQADYKAPPPDPDVVKLAMEGGQPPPRLPIGDPSARFEWQSRTHCDYQPPPLEAFRVTSALPTLLCPDMQPSIPFVGQSSMHADYAAPPVATAFSAPVACRQSAAQDIIHPHPSQKSVSTAHHDYKAPGLEQLRQALVQSGIEAPQIPLPRTKFEGESCTHRDFQAPPSVIPEFRAPLGDAMPAVRELLQPTAGMLNESTTQHDYRAPPLGSWYPDLSSTREETIPLPRTRFQGESTAQADYKAPPPDPDVVKLAMEGGQPPPRLPIGDPSARFEGQSRTHCDYQPPPLEALMLSLKAEDTAMVQEEATFSSTRGGAFEGVSTSHHDFLQPPKEAYPKKPSRRASKLDGEPVAPLQNLWEWLHSAEPTSASPNESSIRADYKAPPPAPTETQFKSGQETQESQHAVHFEATSSMRAHYPPPPAEALSIAPADARSRQGDLPDGFVLATKFEGESTGQRDFVKHPVEALPDLCPTSLDGRSVAQNPPFQGESSMRAHYPAPPPDAFRTATADARCRQDDLQHSSVQATSFEGESTAHRDFQKHPVPVEELPDMSQISRDGNTSEPRYLPFDGESSMRAHYPAPPPDAFRVAPSDVRSRWDHMMQSSVQAAKFEGESTAHRDFQKHPVEELPDLCPTSLDSRSMAHTLPFEGESSMQSHYKAPPQDAFKVAPADARSRQGDLQHSSAQAAQFEGESTAHRDFQAHPVQPLPELPPDRSVVHTLPFEGESSMQSHYKAPPQDAFKVAPADARSRQGDLQHSSAQAAQFEGESTAHRDFQAHPVQPLPELPPDRSVVHTLPFEGESSMQSHYKAPPQDAFKVAPADARSRQGDLQHSSAQAAQFEGESTAHRDFQAHPVQPLPELPPDRSVVHTLPFEGESSMQSHYKAPPQDAFKVAPADARSRQGDLQHSSAQAAQFEGESTAHRDFQAHPVQPLPELPPDRSVVHTLPFEGESSMQSHYRAPPQDAFKVAPVDARSRQGDLQHSSAQAVQFEGESTAHRDFQAHPVQPLPELPPDRSVVHTLPFEGESSMQSHYKAPPQYAFKVAPADARSRQGDLQHSSARAVQFEGESTAHRDFQAHPVQPLPELPPDRSVVHTLPFEGESSMQSHYKAPPQDAFKVAPADARSRAGDLQHSSAQAVKFEGESTAHRDFQAHPVQGFLGLPPDRSVVQTLPFEGQSSMQAHYKAPPQDAFKVAPVDARSRAGDLQHSSAQAAKFEGESTAHRDFRAHPVPALQEARPESSVMPCQLPFEGKSSMRAHYQAPPPDAFNFAPVDAQSRQGEMQHGPAEAAKFEGESTAHRDFQAPPTQALKHFPTLDRRSVPCSLPSMARLLCGLTTNHRHGRPSCCKHSTLQLQCGSLKISGLHPARSDSQAHWEPGQQLGQGQVASSGRRGQPLCVPRDGGFAARLRHPNTSQAPRGNLPLPGGAAASCIAQIRNVS